MAAEPFTLELVKITTKDGKVIYQAVDEKTAENIVNSAAGSSYFQNPDLRFDADYLHEVQVYVPDWMAEAIREGGN